MPKNPQPPPQRGKTHKNTLRQTLPQRNIGADLKNALLRRQG
jgi:hypothetical protein